MHSPPARYLVLIEAPGETVARLFDAERKHLTDFDASSQEVAVMTQGLAPIEGADDPAWARALSGHNAAERRSARVFTLDV